MRNRYTALLLSCLVSITPALAQGASFSSAFQRLGGHGGDGAITISGSTTYSGPIQKNATTFTVNSSQTLTCDTSSPVIINAQRTISISGTVTATGGGFKGGTGGTAASYNGRCGSGPGGGGSNHPLQAAVGGGGGGSSGKGGRGGYVTAGSIYGGSGGSGNAFSWYGGSGGGGGNGDGSSGVGGAGGDGGITIMFIADGAISAASTGAVTMNGAAGSAGSVAGGGGGGGGGAGFVNFISRTSVTLNASSVITTNGGAGGNDNGTAGGAGGGGGGSRTAWSPSNTLSGTTTATAGAAGTGDQNGEAGTDGTARSIVATPAYPLLVWYYDKGGHDMLNPICEIDKMINGSGHWTEFKGSDLAWMASNGDINKYCMYMTPGLEADTPVSCLNTAEDNKEALRNVS